MDEGVALLVVGAVLAASVLVALGSARTGVPVLVAFLALGMLLGSDGPGGIEFDDAELARQVGIVGLVLILFEGGLQTSWRRLRSVAVPAALLSTVGVVVTAILTGVAAQAALRPHLARSHPARRRRRVHGRSGRLRDPALHADQAPARAHARSRVGRQRSDGDRADARSDRLDREPRDVRIRRARPARRPSARARSPGRRGPRARRDMGVRPSPARGRPVRARRITCRGCDCPSELRTSIGGSGFLSVYLVGLAIGSTPSRYRRQLVGFHEGLAFLAQVALFIVLGLLVFPRQLTDVAASGLALALLLVFLIRPAAVWVSTAFNDFTDPRAAAARLGRAQGGGPDRARDVRAVIRGRRTRTRSSTPSSSSSWSRRSCRARHSNGSPDASASSRRLAPRTSRRSRSARPSTLDLLDFVVAPEHAIAGAAVREVGLPRTAIIAVVVRGDDSIPPRGSTIIEPGDRLFVLAPHSVRAAVEDVFARWRRRV